jgi:hypothetical protein
MDGFFCIIFLPFGGLIIFSYMLLKAVCQSEVHVRDKSI